MHCSVERFAARSQLSGSLVVADKFFQQPQYLAELIRYYEAPIDNCDLAAKTFYRTVHQFRTFLSVLFVMPHLQFGIVFLKLLFLI